MIQEHRLVIQAKVSMVYPPALKRMVYPPALKPYLLLPLSYVRVFCFGEAVFFCSLLPHLSSFR